MEQIDIYTQHSQYRDDFRIKGYRFGGGNKTLAVVGSTRGNEYQQLYSCALLVKRLEELENEGTLSEDCGVLVIPCANPWSLNIRKRFWSIDNTDINRMFPGYSGGETTQRIAAGIFDAVKDYEIGIQFASFYMRGSFAPHVRIMHTGFEDAEKAKLFGLPYVIVRDPRPFDTTTLNYNWQIWETAAYSIYTTSTETVDRESASDAVDAIVRFMTFNGLIRRPGQHDVSEDHLRDGNGFSDTHEDGNDAEPEQTLYSGLADDVRIVSDDNIVTVRTVEAGFFRSEVKPGYPVKAGEELAVIEDSYDAHVRCRIIAPVSGTILFVHSDDMCYADSAVYKIIV